MIRLSNIRQVASSSCSESVGQNFVPKDFPTTHKIPSTMPKHWDLHAPSPLMLRPPQSTAVSEVQDSEISKYPAWLEAFAARSAHTSTMSATSMVGVYNFLQKVLRFIRDSATKNNIQNDITLVDDLVQRANSMALEVHIMAHNSGITSTELFTHLHMLRRRSILESPTVDLPQRDKDRLLVMPVGGNDLFGPDARKVHEWKLDTEEEKVKLISRVFDEREHCDKSKKKPSSSESRPPRSVAHRSPLDALSRPKLRTLIIKNLVSPFGDLPSSPPTRLAPEHSPSLKPSAETGTHLPITGPIPVNRDSTVGTRSPKVLSPFAPLTRKVGEVEAVRAANRKEQLPVGGKLVHFQDSWTKLFPQHPEIVLKVSQGILIAFEDVLPSLLRNPLELPSGPPPRCSETSTFTGHRGGDGHYVAGILQPPVSSPETRRILPSNHRLEEVKSIHHSSLLQNGDTLLHYSSPSTTGMDHKNRSKGRVPSHSGPRQHPQILSFRCSRDSLSIPCSSIWVLDGSKGIHQDSSSCGPAFTLSRNYSTSTIIGLDNQLGQINVTTLTNPGLSGFTFQPRTNPYSPPDSFLPTLTNVLSRLSPSTVMTARKVSSIISRMSHFAPFISSGHLHLRFLQFWFKAQWSQHQQSWHTPIQLDTDFLTYLRWFQRPYWPSQLPTHCTDQLSMQSSGAHD